MNIKKNITVKRIFKFKIFGKEFILKIPIPLYYPKWKHNSEWTMKSKQNFKYDTRKKSRRVSTTISV